MKLIAETSDGLQQMMKWLDVPAEMSANRGMSNREYQEWLEDYGISASIPVIKKYRGV